MQLTKEQAQDIVCRQTTWEKVDSNLVDRTRWSVVYEEIWKNPTDAKCYQFSFCRGATESQEERPYEYESEPIEVPEVKQVEKTVLVWEEVK